MSDFDVGYGSLRNYAQLPVFDWLSPHGIARTLWVPCLYVVHDKSHISGVGLGARCSPPPLFRCDMPRRQAPPLVGDGYRGNLNTRCGVPAPPRRPCDNWCKISVAARAVHAVHDTWCIHHDAVLKPPGDGNCDKHSPSRRIGGAHDRKCMPDGRAWEQLKLVQQPYRGNWHNVTGPAAQRGLRDRSCRPGADPLLHC